MGEDHGLGGSHMSSKKDLASSRLVSKKEKIFNWIIFVLLLLGAVVMVFPLIYMIATSFMTKNQILSGTLTILPDPILIGKYSEVLKKGQFINGIFNSLKVAIPVLIIGGFTSSLAAFGFAKMRFRGKNALFLALLATIMIPFAVVMIPQYVMFTKLGWTNTLLPLIIPGCFGNVSIIFFLRQNLIGIPDDLMEAANGEEGIEMLKKYGRDVSLVLLDIIMPVMDGFGVLKRMKEKRMIEEVPVIMISAEVSIPTIRQAYEMGVADYISRPFDAQIVCNRVFNTIKLYAKQSRLMKILTDQAKEKERGQKIMVDILSQIVEFRNGESAPHVHHINILTQMLLEQLEQQTEQYQISPMQRDLIVLASSLHDIGKIGISEKILNKPGPLTAEEYNEMKKHTLIGAQILKNLEIYKDEPLVKVAYKICRWHHERFDGNGYPDGMEGNMIPIAAQVVSVADAYDALVSERTYGKGIPSNQAIRMMKDGECGAFNPILIRCLEIIQDEIPEKVYNRKTLSDNEGTAEERMHHIVS